MEMRERSLYDREKKLDLDEMNRLKRASGMQDEISALLDEVVKANNEVNRRMEICMAKEARLKEIIEALKTKKQELDEREKMLDFREKQFEQRFSGSFSFDNFEDEQR